MMPLRQLVASKLADFPGEFMLFGQYQRLPAARPSFEAHKTAALLAMSKAFSDKQASLQSPPDPSLISIKSWQYGLTDAGDTSAAARSFRDGLFLRLQSYPGDYIDSTRWRTYLEAFEHPQRWMTLGCDAEDEGWTVEANACFAAARWLDPASEDQIAEITGRRSPELPARLLRQPDSSYPAQTFDRRHWLAWDMKNYGRLDLPTLLRWECDRNFSVRTRIYRSLGQRPHPASIQALHEGIHDPHPFARAQAVRALGWCADPTFVERLDELAVVDPNPEVRRGAAKANQRIHGFWRFYGEWNDIIGSAARMREVARTLIDEGLPAFAYDLVVEFGMYDDDDLDVLFAGVNAPVHEREQSDQKANDRARYGHWFHAAKQIEASPEPPVEPERARADIAEPGAIGFDARRTVRRLGIGSIAERRARAPEWFGDPRG
jgi:hypothetical protein